MQRLLDDLQACRACHAVDIEICGPTFTWLFLCRLYETCVKVVVLDVKNLDIKGLAQLQDSLNDKSGEYAASHGARRMRPKADAC